MYRNFVRHRGRGDDDLGVELLAHPLLEDLHVQHAQEAEPPAAPHRQRRVQRHGDASVVQARPLDGALQFGQLRRF